MARWEVLEITALLEAMEAERHTPVMVARLHKPRPRSAVGRVLTMAHQLGRDSAPLTDLSVCKTSILH